MKNTIPLTPVESSQIASIGHDPATNTMAVQFRRKGGLGSTYVLQNVTPKRFEAFRSAESLGKHYGATFRADPKAFPCVKCEDEDEDEDEEKE